jgi:simple sugar transport system substrate-binding protein
MAEDPRDTVGDALERLEWDERKDDSRLTKWRQVTRRTALTGGAAGVVGLALQACGGSSSSKAASTGASGAKAIFGDSGYHFVMVNHVTTNVFFTPTQYGAADACKLLGCSYTWTGSETSDVAQMVNAINGAVASRASGIATTMIAPTAFIKPVKAAMAAGIPVVSYNADEPDTGRLAYIGQDLYAAGELMGRQIISLVPSGEVGLFIATPGAANIQPRINGAEAVLKSHPSIKYSVVATGAAVPGELTTIESWATGHPNAKGMFAVDGGSTQGVAETILKQGLRAKGWKGGGFDTTPISVELLDKGYIDFTIYQQPYLQGFQPILELFLYKASGGQTGAADVDTGLEVLTKSNIGPFYTTKSRYNGTSTAPGLQKA